MCRTPLKILLLLEDGVRCTFHHSSHEINQNSQTLHVNRQSSEKGKVDWLGTSHRKQHSRWVPRIFFLPRISDWILEKLAPWEYWYMDKIGPRKACPFCSQGARKRAAKQYWKLLEDNILTTAKTTEKITVPYSVSISKDQVGTLDLYPWQAVRRLS